jgi:hypothetical protein
LATGGIVNTCPKCGALAALGSTYCAQCGTRLDPSAEPPAGSFPAQLTPISLEPRKRHGLAIVGAVVGIMAILFIVISLIVGHALWKKVRHVQGDILTKLDINNAARAEEIYRAQYDTYSSNVADLQRAGFSANPRTVISFESNGYDGFCIVAASAHGGDWYLHDSLRGGLAVTTYDDRDSAKAACSLGAAAFVDVG